ncbi:hypothetical protein PC110_g3730 [Phytophthora cactorum]|uniref:Uncharacterized protein n=1 Tax=Phytophthora cactorum TaxID=29920 RepID=A0A329STN8_9STRA|nr:hypothetical protein PC110_g3730 [Phytophthora cactorum]
MTLLNNSCNPIDYPSPCVMPQSSALPLPTHQEPIDSKFCTNSPSLNELVISHNLQLPASNPALIKPGPRWLKPMSVIRPDPTEMPLTLPLEVLLALPLPYKVKNNRSKKCQVAGCNTKKQSNGRQWVGANATAEVRAARSQAALPVARVEACVAHMVVASCAPLLAAGKALNVKGNVPHMPLGSVAFTTARPSLVVKASADATSRQKQLSTSSGQRNELNNSNFLCSCYSATLDILVHVVDISAQGIPMKQ